MSLYSAKDGSVLQCRFHADNDKQAQVIIAGRYPYKDLKVELLMYFGTRPMKTGFKDLNGSVWSDAMVMSYNGYNRDIKRTTYPKTIDYLLDNRHKLFVMVADSLSQVVAA